MSTNFGQSWCSRHIEKKPVPSTVFRKTLLAKLSHETEFKLTSDAVSARSTAEVTVAVIEESTSTAPEPVVACCGCGTIKRDSGPPANDCKQEFKNNSRPRQCFHDEARILESL